MKAKFTKGPWIKGGSDDGGGCVNHIYSDDATGSAVANVKFSIVRRRSDELEANAHLIAAAPDMYALLDELSAFLSFKVKDDTLKGLKLNVDTLLAKARGES